MKNDPAFINWKRIQEQEDQEMKQRVWLEDYHGLQFGIAMNRVHQFQWQKNPKYYDLREFNPMINLIGRKKDRLVIEFDEVEDDEKNPKEALEKVKKILEENKWGYIESTHGSKNSNYLWIEFTKPLNTKEAKRFLNWICPDGSRIDTNFTSDKKLFPVLFARHWKYSQTFELPIKFFEGYKIDFDSLNIPKTNPKETINIGNDGFIYQTINAGKMFSAKGRAELYTKWHPLFYDRSGMFWLWNREEFFWENVDETDILNMIAEATGQDIITPKNRTLILNSLKQEGRKKIPLPVKPTWIQFKDKIIDLETAEEFEATPKYFVTNPIPQEIGEFPDTPTMDRIFEEWVGKEYVELLYEIIAYCLLPDMPIHRIFCFIGSGMNGKSKYLELLRNFIGNYNCCSTELDTLLQSRFEVTRLHKKLVCQMGETDFNEMKKTGMLKKLSGGDLIGFEYKNKTPFEDKNYAKIIIATNNLPATTDKTVGFYRRWLIIDFPNQFSEKKDILGEIPEQEYKNLALKSIIYLKSLLKRREFTNEGSIEERIEKYEKKSNFLEDFIKENIKRDDGNNITKADFYKKFKAWCKENRHREMAENTVGRMMKRLGYEEARKHFDWLYDGKGGQLRVWMDISWKE